MRPKEGNGKKRRERRRRVTLPELGQAAAGMSGMVVSLAVKRLAQKLAAGRQLRKATEEAENLLFNVRGVLPKARPHRKNFE